MQFGINPVKSVSDSLIFRVSATFPVRQNLLMRMALKNEFANSLKEVIEKTTGKS